MGASEVAAARSPKQPQGRSSASVGSSGTDGDHLRAEDRDRVGMAAAGNGLRQRDDVLAPTTRVAGGGGVGTPAASDTARVARQREDRLESSLYRRIKRTGKKGGLKRGGIQWIGGVRAANTI